MRARLLISVLLFVDAQRLELYPCFANLDALRPRVLEVSGSSTAFFEPAAPVGTTTEFAGPRPGATF